MFQHVGVVIGGEQGVDGHRHQTGIHRTQKTDRPIPAIVHQQHHTLLALDAQRLQAGRDAAHAHVKLPVAQRSLVIDKGHFVGSLRVGLQQVLRKVERVGRRRNPGLRAVAGG